MSKLWHVFYLGLIAVLLFALLSEGAQVQRAAMKQSLEIAPKDAYAAIRKAPARYQVLDLRKSEEFLDGHLPGAVNLSPGFVLKNVPLDRYTRILVVSEDGDPKLFKALSRQLKLATNLTGGMMQWRMSRLPEVTGATDTEGARRGPVG
jgi:rhodanese-related sulfurtransferase